MSGHAYLHVSFFFHNHNICIVADPTPMGVDYAAHACRCIVRPQCFLSESWRHTHFNPFKPEFTIIAIVIHYKPRITVAILDF